MSVFQPLSFDAFKVGKIFKGSKRKYTWKILLDSLPYTVDMYYSKLSTKVKILVNNEIVVNTRATESHYYKFKIRHRPLVLLKSGENFDLRYGTVSAETVIKNKGNRREEGRSLEENKESRRLSTPRVPLRKSLPFNMGEVPVVNFRKSVMEIDLLEIDDRVSKNPFDDEVERVEDERKYKTESLIDINSVPWPSTNPFVFSSNRYE